jgi:very-short-patch-repair endonuclease
MKPSQSSYNNLSKEDRKAIIEKLYLIENKSFYDIAKEYDTYANKIRRDAVSFKIPIRDKSAAQKNALKVGNHKHPTKGKSRDQKTKDKIGLGVLSSWAELPAAELDKRKKNAKKQWEDMTVDQKESILKMANDAVRLSSKLGSKLENFLLSKLIADGYKVDFHKEQTLSNTKLQIDLFLPKIDVAIEVDGPSHFLPVWGDDTLKKNITYDQKKQGLILGKGWKLIRIKQKKDFSNARAGLLYDSLMSVIKSIESKTDNNQNLFIIEDIND